MQCLIFFKDYLKVKTIAVVPSSIRMPQHIAKRMLLQLLESREGETASVSLSRERVKGAKRTCYDPETAASWHTKCILFRDTRLQLLCPAIMKRDAIATSSTSRTTPTRNTAVLSENFGSWSGCDHCPTYFLGKCVMLGDVSGSGVSEWIGGV